MKWKLEITNEELAKTFGEILFGALLPDAEPAIDLRLQTEVGYDNIRYTCVQNLFTVDKIKNLLLNHEDMQGVSLAENAFVNCQAFILNIPVYLNDVDILYDIENYLVLFRVFDHVYKFNLGAYLMMVQFEEYAETMELNSILDSLEQDKEKQELEDDFGSDGLVM